MVKYTRKTRRPRRRFTRRRFTRRGARSGRPTGNMPMVQWRSPLPPKFKTTLRYQTTQSIDPALASIGYKIFSANGMYDPDISGAGHQPRGFDQLMAMYDHYTVVGSRIVIQAVADNDNTYNQFVGISVKDAAAPLSDQNEYMEGRGTAWKICGAGNAAQPITLVNKFSLRKFQSVSRPLSNNDSRGNISSNPAEESYYHIWTIPVNTSANAGPIRMSVTIDYIAIFTEPHTPSQS